MNSEWRFLRAGRAEDEVITVTSAISRKSTTPSRARLRIFMHAAFQWALTLEDRTDTPRKRVLNR
jgi:hypothetical protein